MYDEGTQACSLFRNITDEILEQTTPTVPNSPGSDNHPQSDDYEFAIWPKGLPWLYYKSEKDGIDVKAIMDSTIDLKVMFELDEESGPAVGATQ